MPGSSSEGLWARDNNGDALSPESDPANRPLCPVVVVGAGPAGLATSFELQRRGIEHVVLERGGRPGAVWHALYDSLTLHTGRHMSHLPGLPIPRTAGLFVRRADFAAYLQSYARRFDLPVLTDTDVVRIGRGDGAWILSTRRGEIRARLVVMATGIVSNPVLPEFPGQASFAGTLLHASRYQRPEDAPGPRVLVVGAGNSGGEIASELAAAGRQVDIAVRSGANVVPLTLAGIPIQYLAHLLLKTPPAFRNAVVTGVGRLVELRRGRSPLPPSPSRPLDATPLIGFHLVDAIRAGKVGVKPGVASLTADGATFVDGRHEAYASVVLATGYRAALASLGELVKTDARGFAQRIDRVTSRDQPGLFFVGQTYDASGALHNIATDAGLAAAAITRALAVRNGGPAGGAVSS